MAETTESPTKRLSFEQLAAARKSTQAVSDFLEKQLLGYLDTLRFLLVPERLLGKLAGSKFDVPGADKVLTELQENYRRLPGKPFDFPKEFENDWLADTRPVPETHLATDPGVALSSPVAPPMVGTSSHQR